MYTLKNRFVENFLHDNAFLRGHNMPTWATTGFPFWGAMQETPTMNVQVVFHAGPPKSRNVHVPKLKFWVFIFKFWTLHPYLGTLKCSDCHKKGHGVSLDLFWCTFKILASYSVVLEEFVDKQTHRHTDWCTLLWRINGFIPDGLWCPPLPLVSHLTQADSKKIFPNRIRPFWGLYSQISGLPSSFR